MESSILKMAPKYEDFNSPFIALQKEIAEFTEKVDHLQCRPDEKDLHYRHILVFIEQCEDFIKETYKQTDKFGITLRVNQNLMRIKQQLERLTILLSTLVADQNRTRMEASIDLWLLLIKLNYRKNDLKTLIYESTRVITYEITQFTGKTGERYITFTSKAYWKMFLSAMGGGAIVAFFGINKVVLKDLSSVEQSSFFFQGLVYSFNYSLAFVMIYLFRFTLATKQPAMTASTLAQTLTKDIKEQNNNQKYKNLSVLSSALIRSQFIAFVGNILIAMPFVYIILNSLDNSGITSSPFGNTQYLRESLHPFQSYSFFYAAIAGFYLFLSGIIAGSAQNRLRYYNIPDRIRHHPLLISSIGKKWSARIANFYFKNNAGIISNIWFGIFLGITAPIGALTGIDIDVRHITFASVNLALVIHETNLPLSEVLLLGFSVITIGIINFSVSFGLTLIIALRSRGIALSELTKIITSFLKYFRHTPLKFFFPVNLDKDDGPRTPEQRFDQRRRAT